MIMDVINYLYGIMASSWRTKDGATSFVYIIDTLWCQGNSITSIEALVSILQVELSK